MANAARLLVYGGSGALGKQVIAHFKSAGWHTTSVDFVANTNADANHTLNVNGHWKQNTQDVSKALKKVGGPIHTVINVAGGWMGGNATSDTGVFDALDKMWEFNVKSAFAASYLAAHHLCPQKGLLALTGAAPVLLGPTPEMISYGACKAAVHHLVGSLSQGGLPGKASVVGILPITIDTPANRAAFGDKADYSSWTTPEVIAQQLLVWSQGLQRVTSGGLYIFRTKNFETSVTLSTASAAPSASAAAEEAAAEP